MSDFYEPELDDGTETRDILDDPIALGQIMAGLDDIVRGDVLDFTDGEMDV